MDDYVKNIQPKTPEEISVVYERILPEIEAFNTLCVNNKMIQVIVIDMNKGLNYEKFNFVTTGPLCKLFANRFEGFGLLEAIELRNVHQMAISIWNASKIFIPKELRNLIFVYSD
jgi:hypothetical protein